MWISSLALISITGVVFVVGYTVYRATFPKPIPGIPYVIASSNKPFGDVPDALKYTAEHMEIFPFLKKRCLELNSPVIQVFLRPFKRPWVVVMDSREAHEILARRTREFDRADFFMDLFGAIIPHHQIVMKTTPQWRSNRRLVSDIVSPHFMQNVVAPRTYSAVQDLISLWRSKARLADSRPFEASEDILGMILDAVFGFTFGRGAGTIRSQNDQLTELGDHQKQSGQKDMVASFPKAPRPATYEAIVTVTRSSEISAKSPLGPLHHRFATIFYPGLRSAIKFKDQLVRDRLYVAWKRSNDGSHSDETEIECAADVMVQRGIKMAKKEDRAPHHDSPTMQDELFGILEAAHETTSTSCAWICKYLTRYQEVQQKLRSILREAFPIAAAKGEMPTAVDIATLRVPYLDAVIEEILRCAAPASSIPRVAIQDTEILGYHIPKGTNVFMPTTGPSYTAPPFKIDDKKRANHGQGAEKPIWNGNWDTSALDIFQPERWLVKNEHGETEFDSRAGPMHIFGAGIRGCFGRRLAYLSLRIVFTLVVWNFQLLPLPAELDELKGMDVIARQPQQTYVRLSVLSP